MRNPFNEWMQSHTVLLRRWLAWWQAYPDLPLSRPLLILLYVTYNREWPVGLVTWYNVREVLSAAETEIRAATASGRLIGAMLPPLDSLTMADAINWARDYLVNWDRDEVRRRLDRKFKRPFGFGYRRLPMQQVVEELQLLLVKT